MLIWVPVPVLIWVPVLIEVPVLFRAWAVRFREGALEVRMRALPPVR